MPAIPFIAPIAGTVIGGLFNRKTQGEKNQEGLFKEQSALSREMSGFARNQVAFGQPALNKAMTYYTKLASGNRGAMDSALAPDRAALNDSYKGSSMALSHGVGRGPRRDEALSKLNQQRAGQLGLMPFMAKQNAVGQMGRMGESAMGRALSAYGGAGNAFAQAGTTANQVTNNQMERQSNWGDMAGDLFDIYSPYIFGDMPKRGTT